MTEAEALDEAAKSAVWGVWGAIRAHAATLMENAALKAEIERLKGYAEHGKRSDGEACSAAWVKSAECDCGLNALIKEIEGD